VFSTEMLCSEITGPEAIEDAFPCPCGLPTCRATVPARPAAPVPLREEAGTLAVETCEPMPEFGFSGEWEAFSLYVTRYSDGAEFWEALDSEGRLTWEGEREPDAQSIIDALVMASAPDVLPQECP
jgi:hypothetical protein